MAKKTQVQIAQQQVTTETKEIKLDFIRMCQRKNEIHKREKKAKAYIKKCEEKKEERRNTISGLLVIAFFVFMLVAIYNAKANAKDNESGRTYIMQGELQGNHVVLSDGNIHEVSKEYANYTREPNQVTVLLNDNGTRDVTDDIIISIR